MEKRIFYFVIAFIMSLGFTTAQAQNSYVGLSAIVSGEMSFDDNAIPDDEYNSGWLLNYGYQFTDMFSSELAYGRLSDVEDGLYRFKSELEVMEVSVLARMPGQIASPFIRLGYSDADFSGSDNDATNAAGEVVGASFNYSESDFLIGVGVDFNIGDSGAIRLEYNQADYGDDFELERVQLGTIIRF